jgi:uncharacterized membrane protein
MDILLRGNALFALAAAILWGGGDFSGGMGVKATGGGLRGALRVVLLSHAASFTALVIIAHLRGDIFPHGPFLVWGIAAGVAGGLSLTCFYIALSRGAMGAPAAISGLLAAAIPTAFAIARLGSPGLRPLVGFVIAGAAIWLIAAGPSPENASPSTRSTMIFASVAGIGFGIYFTALKMASPAGVVWPMATARIGSLTTCSLFALIMMLKPEDPVAVTAKLNPNAVAFALGTALLDTTGNLLFLTATRAGRLDVAAVVASLYPASTILLAALWLHERPTRRQAIGMLTAGIALMLIVL